AVECFRLAAAGARPETQIQTHMCYSEFGEIFADIDALDADVLLIEHARSDRELLEIFRSEGYDSLHAAPNAHPVGLTNLTLIRIGCARCGTMSEKEAPCRTETS
ncbi:MAG: hypothetical protein M3Q50_11410, partial [Chloroflexota bacterium]|nr:hypothetical protein [Chloroflexota bacterium]